jgi:hypothetical protein
MEIRQFAEQHRLRVKNTGAELVVLGRFGEIADDYGNGYLRLRLLAVPRSSTKHNRALNARGKQAEAAGMKFHERGGYESIWLFRPEDEAHAALAIRLVGTGRKRTRILTPEQKAVLTQRLVLARTAKSQTAP